MLTMVAYWQWLHADSGCMQAISAMLPTNSPVRAQTTEIATSPMKLSPEKKAAAGEASSEGWVSTAEETEVRRAACRESQSEE